MRSSVLLSACVAVACAGSAAAFAPLLSPAPRLLRAAPAVCAAKATPADGWKPAAILANSLLAASLILSPVLTVFNGPDASFGGAAHAQGATSSKLTAGAPSADANKDPESILRLSLPINEKSPIREAANEIELKMDKALREIRAEKWGKIGGMAAKSKNIITNKQKDILKDIPAARQEQAVALFAEAGKELDTLRETIVEQKVEKVYEQKRLAARAIGNIEQLMVKEFPYQVPAEYANLPRLEGRAEVEMVIKKADPLAKFDVDGTVYDKVVLKMVLDGYTAPITSGRFLNLVEKGFYNNMIVQRSDGFVIQTGDPNFEQEDLPHGDVDAKGEVKTIPLEVYAEEDVMPTYGVTLEDDGRPLSQPKLPFSVYGTLAMARSEDNANDASSQFFFLLFDPELTTAGRNLMDGRFATFGYVVDGGRLLSNVEQGDTIISATITAGKDHLVNGK